MSATLAAMSDNVILAIIVAVAPTMAAIGAIVVGIINGRKSDAIDKKATEIHTLTNSSLSKVQSSLETANEKIVGLEKLVGSMTAANVASASKDALLAAQRPAAPAEENKLK